MKWLRKKEKGKKEGKRQVNEGMERCETNITRLVWKVTEWSGNDANDE